jgi:hypothetical protein
MSSATFYKWHAKYGGMDTSMITRLKELEAENSRLKRMYADERLQVMIVQEALSVLLSINQTSIDFMSDSLNTDREIRIFNVIDDYNRECLGIELMYIQPGKPTQNAYIERFNRTARNEWLNKHIFDSIEHAQNLATQWMWVYNNERPHSSIGGIPPRRLFKQRRFYF